jgi:hypothetical protein
MVVPDARALHAPPKRVVRDTVATADDSERGQIFHTPSLTSWNSRNKNTRSVITKS